MQPSLIESLAIGVFGAAVTAYLSNRFARGRSQEENVYIPLYNAVQGVVNSLNYNSNRGEFQKVWERLDGHIKRGINQDIKGPLVLLDGNIHSLNLFMTNYKIALKHMASESKFVKENDEEIFLIVDEGVEVPVDEFINRFGETIITTSEKADLWERLNWEAEHGQLYSAINHWKPSGERIDLLWSTRQRVYKEGQMIKPPDEIYSDSIDYARTASESLESKIDYL